jgi:hypothetical protein
MTRDAINPGIGSIRRISEEKMNILYVAPDIPVPHTGDFVGGSTHVLKVAEGLAKRRNESENIFTRRVY